MKRRPMLIGVLAGLALPLLGAWLAPRHGGLPVAAAQAANKLDLTNYQVIFDEPFDSVNVSPWGPGTRWIAHTPWNGDFGDARFADPMPGFPFTTTNGILRIEARKDPAFAVSDPYKRPWRSGLLASNDRNGNGFAAQYGYFEISAKLPAGVGVWPAFWLVSKRAPLPTGQDTSIEIDVIEYYGAAAKYQEVIHIWKPDPHRSVGTTITTPANAPSTGFHRYGVMVTPSNLVFYYDGSLVWARPTPLEHKKPLMILLNLALGSGFPTANVPSPTFMYVDYVRVWGPK